jgi:GTP cyclohydrolase II
MTVDGTVLRLGAAPVDTVHGRFTVHRFHNLATGVPALVLTRGDVTTAEAVLARVHSSCVTSEAYRGRDCDCAEQLDAALAAIDHAGRGALFYLMQEGRGAGFVAKARDRMLVQASRQGLTTFDAYDRMGLPRDQRRYGEVAATRRLLGIAAPLRLLTNNPEKISALTSEAIPVDGTRPLALAASPYSAHYLTAKSGTGHTLPPADARPAALPEPVENFAPHPLPGASHIVRLASYLLPVGGPTPAWFRLHLYFDAEAGRERVVLAHGRSDSSRPTLVRVQAEALLERFPPRTPRLRAEWLATVAEIVDHGAGAVLFRHVVDVGEAEAAPDEAALALLATHAGAAGGRVLTAAARPTATEVGLARALAALGAAAGPPVALGATG